MNLQMDDRVAWEYHSNAQKIRVITESWVNNNLFCPYCGNTYIRQFENNRPVADFYCPNCLEEYELKSKKASINNKIAGGAYDTMIERINSINNPNFFFLHYGKEDLKVKNFIMVPKHFFVPSIIEKRNPLADTARRAGWVGCNIVLRQIPCEGRIYIIKDEIEQPIDSIIANVKKTIFIKQFKIDARGWIIDILNCINKIDGDEFTLNQIYHFVESLALKHPENHYIKDKIRQQLQILRDKGIIEFKGSGHYKKC
ncbi:restriction endonuclease [Lachnospiraceae bacterium WCA-9-b2]|uniref:Restriction endonuclease n=1 Tax=Sporofaciens musculi TaxID=2681861 RepID=A0A7X3MJA1_9FIRM|nr:DpnI domain-containing protein [Sporofaciens musculi]MXP77460.1 restriction endonuclease [Sporofaciens musculi]